MEFIKKFLLGFLIGLGAILPGVSSGVFCVIFGLYDKLVSSCSSLFKNFKENFLFLLPIGLGSIIGIFLFGNLIKLLFFNFETECKFAFIGLILGGIPVLFNTIGAEFGKSSSGFFVINPKRIAFPIVLPMLVAFLLGLSMIVLENKLDLVSISETLSSNYLYLILCGALMSIGVVVPGVSNTLILMCLGVYPAYISAISTMNIQFLLPLGVGLIVGSIICIKLIEYLLKKCYKSTFSAIIGFTLGSIFVLLPKFSFSSLLILDITLLLIGFFISYRLSEKA